MKRRLEGKVAIVTGSGRGIGRGEALSLAAEGAKVVVNDVGSELAGQGFSKSPADGVVAEIKQAGGEAVANYDTVATPEGAERIVKSAIETFGGLDILVNNAGNLIVGYIYEMTPEEWDAGIKTHLYGHFNCIRAACIWFKKRWQETGKGGGRIINTSSYSGLGLETDFGPDSPIRLEDILVGRANYGAAKQGVLGLTRAVAIEMRQYGVTCNAIVPSAMTRLAGVTVEGQKEYAKEATSGASKRVNLPPEGVGPFVAYLATDDAASISGCVFRVIEGQVGIFANPIPVRTVYKAGTWTVDELCEAVPRLISGIKTV